VEAKETFMGWWAKSTCRKICEMLERNIYMESVMMVHLGVDFDPTLPASRALLLLQQTLIWSGSIDRLRPGSIMRKEGFFDSIFLHALPSLAPPGCHVPFIP
jgi:hypothetical protein